MASPKPIVEDGPSQGAVTRKCSDMLSDALTQCQTERDTYAEQYTQLRTQNEQLRRERDRAR